MLMFLMETVVFLMANMLEFVLEDMIVFVLAKVLMFLKAEVLVPVSPSASAWGYAGVSVRVTAPFFRG